ncbi:MAG: hypothetical protein Q7T88_11565 [Methylotenera sp.]|nr:hypothetical protein [Methylotenera sp.]
MPTWLIWEQAPFLCLVHPREGGLIPLMVVTSIAGERNFTDKVFGVAMAAYRFG